MNYLEQVQLGMDLLAADSRILFVGQAMRYKGHAVSKQVAKYPKEKRVEFPVMEDSQSGFCIGLALEGYIPVCIYPRHDFAILALNQIINHIDKAPLMGYKDFKIIIKILVGAKKPLDGGHQHTGNYLNGIASMCSTINIIDLKDPRYIVDSYRIALTRPGNFIINEFTEAYE